MKEVTFKLNKDKGIPDRFKSLEAKFMIPETLDEIRSLVSDDVADKDAVIVAGFNGQGYSLGRQKRIKDILAGEEVKKIEDAAEALAFAVKKASDEKLGAPRPRGEGKAAAVAAAEAKAEKMTNTARDMYLKMAAPLRKQFRPQLIADGVFTEAELDEMDESAKR